MNQDLPACLECSSDDTYELGLLVCPHCGREGAPWDPGTVLDGGGRVIRDAVGNVLADGDTVAVVKDLRLKGGSGVIKVGPRYGTFLWSMAWGTTTWSARSTGSVRCS